MKYKAILTVLVLFGLMLTLTVFSSQAQEPASRSKNGLQSDAFSPLSANLSTAFTYQGQLRQGDDPVNEACDFQFGLWDAVSDGAQIGNTQTKSNVSVSDGLFTVQLDFGSGAFQGSARWLAVAVRCPAGSGNYTLLTPRQALTATPYALYSLTAGSAVTASWSGLSGVPAGFADGVDNDSTYTAGTGLTLTGNQFALNTSYTDGRYWKLGGNSLNAEGNLGILNNYALNFLVNNQRTLRLEPHAISPNLVGGHRENSVTSGVMGATISGGGVGGASNRVSDDYGTVGGGYDNRAGDSAGTTSDATGATVSGGFLNTASGEAATIGGGVGNRSTGAYATIGGGGGNTASSLATIGGGSSNTASGEYTTISGGYYNTASGAYATIAGGGSSDPTNPNTTSNRVTDDYGTVGGGGNNQAGNGGDATDAVYATVSGGWSNTASDYYATIGGGSENTAGSPATTVGGGTGNTASGYAATVGGGDHNTASGFAATVPGGYYNVAQGAYSFAAGRRAKAYNDGCFVLADSMNVDEPCVNDNRFVFRVTNSFYIWTTVDHSVGTVLYAGEGAWSPISDRAAKENFAAVDGGDLLERLASIPIETWNYKSQDPSIRHIGPVAQDFYAAFGLGVDDKHISTMDADGVALAAIQGLYRLSQEQATQIAQLEEENTSLRERLDSLEKRLRSLEAAQGTATSPLLYGLLSMMGMLLGAIGLTWVWRRKGGIR